jgi:hypothetical protein
MIANALGIGNAAPPVYYGDIGVARVSKQAAQTNQQAAIAAASANVRRQGFDNQPVLEDEKTQ